MFAQTDERQNPMQQDAEEFWNVFLQKMKPFLMIDPQDGTDRKISLIHKLFNIQTEVTYKNREVPEEAE